MLTVEGISKTIDGVKVLDNISFILGHDDKVAFVGGNEFAKTTLFQILAGELEPDEGTYKWGVTTSQAYFPKDNSREFDNDDTIVDWLTQYSEIKDATYVRGFLGRMLFAGEDGVKKVKVLSGGEKVRCMLSKLMISGANILILDEPTDHLDMEAITALNNGLIKFPGVLLFSSRDHQIVQTTANRIIELLPNGTMVDKITTYDEYLESDAMARKRTVYSSCHGAHRRLFRHVRPDNPRRHLRLLGDLESDFSAGGRPVRLAAVLSDSAGSPGLLYRRNRVCDSDAENDEKSGSPLYFHRNRYSGLPAAGRSSGTDGSGAGAVPDVLCHRRTVAGLHRRRRL